MVTMAVIGCERMEVRFEDGRKALRLAEAAYKSRAERRLVRVGEIAGTPAFLT